jgi:hypothetical protein
MWSYTAIPPYVFMVWCFSEHRESFTVPLQDTLLTDVDERYYLFNARWLIYVPPHLALKEFCILPTQCIYLFRMVLIINSDYFPKQR